MTHHPKMIANYMRNSCHTALGAAQAFGVDEDAVKSALDDNDIDQCDLCGWWKHNSQMVGQEEGGSICLDCRAGLTIDGGKP